MAATRQHACVCVWMGCAYRKRDDFHAAGGPLKGEKGEGAGTAPFLKRGPCPKSPIKKPACLAILPSVQSFSNIYGHPSTYTFSDLSWTWAK